VLSAARFQDAATAPMLGFSTGSFDPHPYQLRPDTNPRSCGGVRPTGLHILRHTAAKLRREAGESIEAVSSFLDHSSLAVTTIYLRRLEGVEDRRWAEVAAAIGV
jgi:integrase